MIYCIESPAFVLHVNHGCKMSAITESQALRVMRWLLWRAHQGDAKEELEGLKKKVMDAVINGTFAELEACTDW